MVVETPVTVVGIDTGGRPTEILVDVEIDVGIPGTVIVTVVVGSGFPVGGGGGGGSDLSR